MAELRLEHIYKTYKGGVEAVKDLNLTVQNGEFLALLGPSGCGKTSTLRMIVGLEEITRGEMYIGSRLVNKLEPNQRNVALAFETYALYPPLRVWENIAFCLRAKNVPPAEISRRVKEVAAMLDISEILERKPSELGGGEKQRVSLARALVRDPDVFLMDEPLSHLDAAQRAHMRVEFKRLHAQTGRTTILVTHDQLEAVAMAERIAVMNFGVLQQVGYLRRGLQPSGQRIRRRFHRRAAHEFPGLHAGQRRRRHVARCCRRQLPGAPAPGSARQDRDRQTGESRLGHPSGAHGSDRRNIG